MLVLLCQSFWIDVWVPHHKSGHERVRHSASSESETGEAFVTAVCLADVDHVAAFRKWATTTWRAARCVVAKRYVR
jgi:hypothetical protein